MKTLIAALCITLLTGCIGSSVNHNPLDRKVTATPWWQNTTVDVKSADNPWEAFVLPHTVEDTSDPWGTYTQPKLFPKGFKPSTEKYLDDQKYHLRLQSIIRSLLRRNEKLRPKVEKEKISPLEELKRREREYFKRKAMKKREI